MEREVRMRCIQSTNIPKVCTSGETGSRHNLFDIGGERSAGQKQSREGDLVRDEPIGLKRAAVRIRGPSEISLILVAANWRDNRLNCSGRRRR
jgi:hypothetical protein